MSIPAPVDTRVRRFAALNMQGPSVSGFSGGLVSLAKAYSMVSMTASQAKPADVDAMHQANPQLVALEYLNATFCHDPNAYPGAWYLKDAKGNKPTSSWGNYPMDPTNPDWIANRIAAARATAAGKFDGAMFDMCGPAPTAPHYLSSQIVNPRTGKLYTAWEWVADTTAELRAIKAGTVGTGVIVVGNGLENGDQFSLTQSLLGAADGALAESWLTLKAGGSVSWKANVDMLASLAAQGKAVCAMRKTWKLTDQAQIDANHVFSLASFLLGAGPYSFYEFSPANTPAGVGNDYAMEHIVLGAPLGPYTIAADGHAERHFVNAVALVNPTPAAVDVALPGWVTLAGVVAAPTITLPAGAGQIVVPA